MNTKIFCDIADKKVISKFNKIRIVKGFTTNPSLMRKAGAIDYEKYCKEIIKITNKPLSFEVFADDEKNMLLQAYKINDWGKNVYVKVPVTNSKGKFMGKVIQDLNSKNIKINVTAVYTAEQTKKILNLIKSNSNVIISIFAGRMADAGHDPLPQVTKSLQISKKYKNVEILWASTREPYNFIQAKQIGCHIITTPPAIIEKIQNFGKKFNQLTVDTVKGFKIDSQKSKFKLIT